jgi:hypothetical protein
MIEYGEIRFVDLRLRIEEIRVRQIKQLDYPDLVPQPLFEHGNKRRANMDIESFGREAFIHKNGPPLHFADNL